MDINISSIFSQPSPRPRIPLSDVIAQPNNANASVGLTAPNLQSVPDPKTVPVEERRRVTAQKFEEFQRERADTQRRRKELEAALAQELGEPQAVSPDSVEGEEIWPALQTQAPLDTPGTTAKVVRPSTTSVATTPRIIKGGEVANRPALSDRRALPPPPARFEQDPPTTQSVATPPVVTQTPVANPLSTQGSSPFAPVTQQEFTSFAPPIAETPAGPLPRDVQGIVLTPPASSTEGFLPPSRYVGRRASATDNRRF